MTIFAENPEMKKVIGDLSLHVRVAEWDSETGRLVLENRYTRETEEFHTAHLDDVVRKLDRLGLIKRGV